MSIRNYLVISGIGPDRPGIVAEASRFLTERGMNVEDSRAAVLGGDFGLMLLAAGTQEALDLVEKEASALEEATGFPWLFRRTKSPEDHRREQALPYRIEANAMDHEGIVQAVTEALYRTGINIVSLQTTLRNAPVTGTPLFVLDARVDIPAGISPESVREKLRAVAQDQGLDLDFRSDLN